MKNAYFPNHDTLIWTLEPISKLTNMKNNSWIYQYGKFEVLFQLLLLYFGIFKRKEVFKIFKNIVQNGTLNLDWKNSFAISIYYMLSYEVNSIIRSLEDLTTYTCFRAHQKAIRIPPNNVFFSIFDNI